MPSDTFYGFIGGIGGLLLIMGATAMGDFGQEGNRTLHYVAPIMFSIATVFFIVLGIGIFYDFRPRFRKWNIERKSEEIDLEEQEQKVQRKRREHEKVSQDETDYDTHSTENTETSSSQDHEESPNAERENEPILKTGGQISHKLSKKEEGTEEEILEPEETHSPDEKYQVRIMLDTNLKFLWTLFETPEHSFPTKNQLIKAAQNGKLHNKTAAYDAFRNLLGYGLIEYTDQKKYDSMFHIPKTRSGVKITSLGLQLMEKARGDRIDTWDNFLEKYKLQPVKK